MARRNSCWHWTSTSMQAVKNCGNQRLAEASGVLLEEVIEDYQSVGLRQCYAPIFRVMAPWQVQTSIYIVKSAQYPDIQFNHRAALVAWQILRR